MCLRRDSVFHQAPTQCGLPGPHTQVTQRETTDHPNRALKDILNLNFAKMYYLPGLTQRNVNRILEHEKGDVNDCLKKYTSIIFSLQ